MSNQRGIKLVSAGVISIVLGLSLFPAQALAWHPDGKITKFVANETAGIASVDANTDKTAVGAKPGDILRYTITVRNDGKPASNGYNDLAYVEITDNLPAGVELVGNPSQRTIKESVPNTLKPGQSVTKEYKVKVTSTKDGEVLKNTACFTGDSTVKDNKQQGCDDALIKVKVEKQPPKEEPKQPEKPKETPKEQPKAPVTPTALPSTGPEAILAGLLGTSAIGYAAVSYRRSRKALADALKK